MKIRALMFLFLTVIAQSAEKKSADVGKKLPAPVSKKVESALPEKTAEMDDPLSLQNLLDPVIPVPEILPAPEALPESPVSSGNSSTRTGAGSARSELIAAANEYRQKAALFRKGKLSRDALSSSAARLSRAARDYRAIVRR